jgi:hypothetical protein
VQREHLPSLRRHNHVILRITLETTVFSSSPDIASADLPQPLQEFLPLSRSLQSFISTLYARSLSLFIPSSHRKHSSALLPNQVLIALVAFSIKRVCPSIGHEITEDWSSKHGQYDFVLPQVIYIKKSQNSTAWMSCLVWASGNEDELLVVKERASLISSSLCRTEHYY